AICAIGARPVFVDIEPTTYCLDPDRIESAITGRTKAILPVHLYGQPADMSAINAIAQQHGLAVIEDACQAHGTTLDGNHAGTFGGVGCFSFYPGKNLSGQGDAGALVTDDDYLAGRIRQLRNRAHRRLVMEAFQAAVLAVKLRYLRDWTESRRRITDWYATGLGDLGCLRLP